MTNRPMVSPEAAKAGPGTPRPDTDPLPPMPSPEGGVSPVTEREPIDSPHVNDEMQHPKRGGLSTDKG